MIRGAFLLLAAAVLGAPSTGTYLVFEPGVYTPEQTAFTAADQPVTIRCAGPGQTVLLAPGGISITYSDQLAAPTVEGCTIATDGQGGTALTITGPVLPTGVQHGPRLRDLAIRGVNPYAQYWERGIRLVDVWNPILRDINVNGMYQLQPPFVQASCVEFERSQVVDIEKLDCYHSQVAVKQLGSTFGEGFSLRDFNLVGVNTGVQLLTTAGYTIADGHMNAYENCLVATGKLQVSIDGVLCYKSHLSQKNFVGLLLLSAKHFRVANSQIEGSKGASEAGTTTGMVLVGVSQSIFGNNICENFKTSGGCIVVGTASNNNTFIGNRNDNGAVSAIQINPDAGPNNYLSGNKP